MPNFFLRLEQRVSDLLAFMLFAMVRELGTITDKDKTPSGTKAISYEKITKGLGLVKDIREGFPEEVTPENGRRRGAKQARGVEGQGDLGQMFAEGKRRRVELGLRVWELGFEESCGSGLSWDFTGRLMES